MERAVSGVIEHREMRNEVVAALFSLSDPAHQRSRWGRVEEGVDYYDDLTLNVHVLYDDTQVLPSPEHATSSVLHPEEVPALQALDRVLGELVRELGDSSDNVYLADPRWADVVDAARAALEVMRSCDEGALDDESPLL